MATRTFPPSQRKQKEAQEQLARTADKGHGRTEYRRLLSTTSLNDYLDWPDVGQVFELERVRLVGGKAEVEVVYGLTSLRREQADAGALLARVRGHWGIEMDLAYYPPKNMLCGPAPPGQGVTGPRHSASCAASARAVQPAVLGLSTAVGIPSTRAGA